MKFFAILAIASTSAFVLAIPVEERQLGSFCSFCKAECDSKDPLSRAATKTMESANAVHLSARETIVLRLIVTSSAETPG
ncbi:hypothetical protein L207DRAFT_593237 [Hyaloscypha variabilis F]|uniref:Uncharacterized protein n=1 Tax=Hyaloscypha variabilis (strain UAMH 11265 / GT02V1 / F) TaxID=1149755 RepID=A0A2J6QTS5_HYAVF|nr:hypothetical protein L207DRAFT_593237 [Hyaloscypha variabilis F]